MNEIIELGNVVVPQDLCEIAESIQDQNNKVNTPAKLQKTRGESIEASPEISAFLTALCELCRIDRDRLNYTLFSCPGGSERHIDLLDPAIYGVDTFVVPILLRSNMTKLYTEHSIVDMNEGLVTKFNHTRPHGLIVGESAPTVLMMFSELTK